MSIYTGVHVLLCHDYIMVHHPTGMVMVMCTRATGHMIRGWGLAGWRRTPSSAPSTLDRGATTREMATASTRIK